MKTIFLHGLDSSGSGTKGSFFQHRFPEIATPDFSGSLEQRLSQLDRLCTTTAMDGESLLLIGSSYGGLMATCYAISNPERVVKLILMAPALNFPGLAVPNQPIVAPTYLLIGSWDDVTPPDAVIPLAKKIFANLEINLVDEDHLLHQSFPKLDWHTLLSLE